MLLLIGATIIKISLLISQFSFTLNRTVSLFPVLFRLAKNTAQVWINIHFPLRSYTRPTPLFRLDHHPTTPRPQPRFRCHTTNTKHFINFKVWLFRLFTSNKFQQLLTFFIRITSSRLLTIRSLQWLRSFRNPCDWNFPWGLDFIF